MAVGGFMFAKTSVKYDATTYPTKRDWGLAVHKARCEAFMRAAKRATEKEGTSAWTGIQTNLYDEFTETIPVDSSDSTTIYIQDYHPLSSDTQGEYPAFVSYFRAPVADDKGNKSEYMIVTASRFNLYSSTRTDSMNINFERVQPTFYNPPTQYAFIGNSCMHSFAANGFNSYDVLSDTTKPGELAIIPHVGGVGQNIYNQSTPSTNNSLVSTPDGALTYYFGYAVKENIIESFYKTSTYNPASTWVISIVGRIFNDDCTAPDWPYGTFGTPIYAGFKKDNDPITKDNMNCYFGLQMDHMSNITFQTLNENGYKFPTRFDTVTWGSSITRAIFNPGLPVCTSRTAVGDNIPYSAMCVSFATLRAIDDVLNGNALDSNDSLAKGFINTDIVRAVPRVLTAGATISNGNFLVMETGQYAYIKFVVGWDPTNESMV